MTSKGSTKNNIKAEDDKNLVMMAPPDGGYGWVITFLACINMFFILGITFSIGTLLDKLVQVF